METDHDYKIENLNKKIKNWFEETAKNLSISPSAEMEEI